MILSDTLIDDSGTVLVTKLAWLVSLTTTPDVLVKVVFEPLKVVTGSLTVVVVEVGLADESSNGNDEDLACMG